MEEQDRSGKSDYSGNSPSTDNPLADPVPDPAPSPSRSSGEPERKEASRTQRLSEAFWEGVSSAKPDNQKQSPTREAAPAPKDRPSSAQPALLDWLIQSGKSTAAAIGDKASSLVDSIADLAKKAPSIPTKWGEAFREGAVSVRRPGAVKPESEAVPPPAGSPTTVGKGIWDSMSQIGDSAAGFVRDALVTFKPGEAGEIEKKIRLGEKKIRELYVEIGREAAESWSSGGPVETEKVRFLMDEFRKQEDIIQKLRATIPTITPANKANGRRPMTPGGPSAPEGIQEEIRTEVEVIATPGIQEKTPPEGNLPGPKPEEPVETGDRSVRPEAEMTLSETPGAEPLAGPLMPESMVTPGLAAQEEAGVGADPNLSSMTDADQEKTEEVPGKNGNRREE
ncbi:MAG: hypothetical protein HY787_18500 [Deltaproteobacteria bacterium]|nr:hypothetical protein [Deltaproteobacteria bacterium]